MDKRQANETLANHYGHEAVKVEDGYLMGTGSDDPCDRSKDDDWYICDRLNYCQQGLSAETLHGMTDPNVLEAFDIVTA